MSKISMGYRSYGTIYGTVHDYDPSGVDLGPKNITGFGLWFTVKTGWDNPASSPQTLFTKSVGTGVTISTGTSGLFTVALSTSDMDRPPKEYVWQASIDPLALGTNVKSIGSGIFEITEGLRHA